MSIGFDCGTYNLVTCQRDKEDKFAHKREVNAFIQVPCGKENRFVFNMMKKSGVPLIEKGDVAYALGESAVTMAYTMSGTELKRPMSDGCVNPKEKDAFQIMSISGFRKVSLRPISKSVISSSGRRRISL